MLHSPHYLSCQVKRNVYDLPCQVKIISDSDESYVLDNCLSCDEHDKGRCHLTVQVDDYHWEMAGPDPSGADDPGVKWLTEEELDSWPAWCG